jgi:hypothetical protein
MMERMDRMDYDILEDVGKMSEPGFVGLKD